ncbi:5-methyltetrahydropteroyltriglutamate--homocysteine S-methyltransferase [Niveibacterium sp. COAC-50]|uniref:5-methyltetrahydropteroyltriglutamate-- homocysteine S-methyltransferase n=1 Tax=Niveibacterium sp. COAC-50 TaxID=2729384 RepID=UPI00155373D2|nr:5-methyltetrahydropteroyltriglutamate--homocysteine S-methyltransferase [Niveibacterium sp. COAC-50]
MTTIHTLGYPRIGAQRELKFALEACWRGETDVAALEACGARLRAANWQRQQNAGLARVTVGDFSFYDPMLDHARMFGATPARFGELGNGLNAVFALARGTPSQPALDMTKWFDTNYHYLVPEIEADTPFRLEASVLLAAVREAQALGHAPKPVLIGPLSFLYLSRSATPGHGLLARAAELAECYASLLAELAGLGVEWVQIDEPILGLELPADWLAAFAPVYAHLAAQGPKRLLATYFDSVSAHADVILKLPIDGLHLDLVRAPAQVLAFLPRLPAHWVLSAGIVDGRNVWRCDLDAALAVLLPLHARLGDRLWLAPSCSLLHVPLTLQQETRFDAELRNWLAFADEKLAELAVLARALDHGADAVAAELAVARAACQSRQHSPRVQVNAVRERVAAIRPEMARRASPYARRAPAQRKRFQLPLLPTTTIGSFPQTPAIRALRAAWKRRELGELAYLGGVREAIADAIARQEALGFDVLVHGEAERNDMVEFFADKLCGFAFTEHAWVQSYGSRCVKPPLIFGDVWRPEAMTVDTARYAQSLTAKPVKGMLTGPVTMLQWSFVRDDLPREAVLKQLALAIRAEVLDLEAAGIGIIQIDEPAFREGLPLKESAWRAALAAAVQAFGLAAGGVADETQIHTHMCYSEFNTVLPAIAAMDADVITIETSRSNMALLDAFGEFEYPNEIGPGVYDIHSPRIPSEADMLHLLERACSVVPIGRLWVNPDCGLKTRGWPETEAALAAMVRAAHAMRARLAEHISAPASEPVSA